MKKKRIALVAGTALAVGVLSFSNTEFASANTFSRAWNDSASTDQCLAAAGDGTTGVRAVMWYCDDEPGQSWTQKAASLDGLDVTVFENTNLDCIDSLDGGAGSAVYVEPCQFDISEAWLPYHTGRVSGYTEWVNAQSGKCLSVANGSIANGAQPILWTCQDTPDQYWGGSLS